MTAIDPVSVEIVRPEKTRAAIAARVIIVVARLFVRGLIVMLAAGHFGLSWSYWDALLACIGVSFLLPTRESDLTLWTRAAGDKQ